MTIVPEGLPIPGRHKENPIKVIDRMEKHVRSGKIKPNQMIKGAAFLIQEAEERGERARELVRPFLQEAVKRAPEGAMQIAFIDRLVELRQKDQTGHNQGDTIRRYIQMGEDLGITAKPEGQRFLDILKKEYPVIEKSKPQIINSEAEFIAVAYRWNKLSKDLNPEDPEYKQKIAELTRLDRMLDAASDRHEDWLEAYNQRLKIPPLQKDALNARNLDDFAAALEQTEGLVDDDGRVWAADDLKAIIAHVVRVPSDLKSLPRIPGLSDKIAELVSLVSIEHYLPPGWWDLHLPAEPEQPALSEEEKAKQEVLERYHDRARAMRVTMPEGDFMPADGARYTTSRVSHLSNS